MKWILFLFVMPIAYFIVVYAGLTLQTYPPRYVGDISVRLLSRDAQKIQFETVDGHTLHGYFVLANPKSPTMILNHGLHTTKENLYPLGNALAREGWNVLLYDMRAHGKSTGKQSSFGFLEQRDIEAAMVYVRGQTDLKNQEIGLYGVSMGASAALHVAARDPSVKTVIADSPCDDLLTLLMSVIQRKYHLPAFPTELFLKGAYALRFQAPIESVSPVSIVAQINPRPILFVYGKQDSLIDEASRTRLIQAAQNTQSVWVSELAGHGDAIQADWGAFRAQVVTFLDRTLPKG